MARKKLNRDKLKLVFWMVLLLTGLFATLKLVKDKQNIESQAAQALTADTRVPWNGERWYLHGANVPWYRWACDFGCGTQNGGVSGNKPVFETAFSKLKDSQMHNARWWVFPGDPWQITRSSNGAPNGLNPKIYEDFDAALDLADTYDLYYTFVLFSAPSAIPSNWINDPLQRQALADTLGQLFAHYASHPRILAWEVFNEGDFDVWDNKVDRENLRETIKAIAASIHTNTPTAYATTSSGFLDGLPMWVGLGLDLYQAHWYDYMSSGNYCARCTDYAAVVAKYNLDKPLIIGELFAGPSTDALARLEDFYAKGYAGSWPWSLFPDRTDDHLAIDFAAAKSFALNHSDIGPRMGTSITPSSVPTTPPSGDQELPMVSITSPMTGTVLSRGSTITVLASATDNIGVTKVEFFEGNSLKCMDSTAPYSCSWKLPKKPNASYSLSAKAYDSAGNSKTSSVVSILTDK
jgi:hypothetical protein